MLELQPSAIHLGDTDILYIPTYSSRNGNYSVRHEFYELVDGKLVRIEIDSKG